MIFAFSKKVPYFSGFKKSTKIYKSTVSLTFTDAKNKGIYALIMKGRIPGASSGYSASIGP